MKTNDPEVIYPDSITINENTWKMRQANRRYMWRQARRVAKYTLMTAGAVAIYGRLSNDKSDEEK